MPGARVASGDRVTLRTVEAEDVPFLQRAGANPEIRYPLGNPLRNREQYEISDERTAPDGFLVCLEGEGTPELLGDDFEDHDLRRIGQVSVADAHYKRPELGYWLVPEVHGEGYGTESVALAVDYVFRQYDTPAVGAGAFDHNDASRRLLESLGFVEEGRRRKFMFVDGAYRDMVQYGLLREEWVEAVDSER
ncbi:Protein N-acetyltransferase, RimJ/RimL family [Halogranum amylolyticum]|uniref:Protein N-acetyltransferase, RimJ/RimL family n=1 Tax=Halogranum amylolyticum TaxID=660520 RepID=A0A1H8PXD3_9EURY|nr:GNAT family protein [Halogranum amylolyticum]SEO46317.1 Protein N-acetyltransferase, RimJ/RimL family [Halogranum amylolyticum]